MTPVNSSANTVEWIFWFLILFYLVTGVAINVFEELPPFIRRRLLFYGKISDDGSSSSGGWMLVPKSWFRHFYIFATAWGSLVILLTTRGYFFTGHIPTPFIDFLNFVCGNQRTVQSTAVETFFGLLLLYIHILIRCYETNFIQIISKKATMNVVQYLTSFFYYFGTITLIVCNGSGFVAQTSIPKLNHQEIPWRVTICIGVFALASYHQFNSHRILVNLRKDNKGRVKSEGHFLPTGGFFDLVSSPHMFFECMIYGAICGIIYTSSSWWAVMGIVIVNQFTTAYQTHLWYSKNFENYPRNRKVIVPFIF
ncbi:Polyprenol reductase [Sergentomyia squamirostris]